MYSEDVRRRHGRGVVNFFETYTKLCDYWTLVDNTGSLRKLWPVEQMAFGFIVLHQEIWDQIMYHYNVYKLKG